MKKRRSFSKDASNHEEATPNLTPLIDVVFVVLIMFIIIAPMLEIDKIKLADAPKKEEKLSQSVQESSPISIYVKDDNSIWLNSVKVQPAQLIPLLKEAKKKYPEKIPQLFQDKKAHFGTYQTVKNAVEQTGFDELDVILQPG
ncbi:MAG: biopolymer transporter ExbD [Chlamydiae bacterium]|nr:biopolymer transporter ExbD [Chlamydiota bacterium]